MGAELAAACCDAARNGRVGPGEKNGEICRGRSQGVYRRHDCGCVTGIGGTVRRRGEDGSAGRKALGRCDVGHGAMVRPVAAATGRQARIVAGIDGGRQRSQAEEQNEEDGERTPHLGFMLHE